jgi:2-iminobutanoate/2-iminopropanoate deaminase
MAKRKVLHTRAAPTPVASYSQAIRSGKLVFCSGQIAIDPRTGTLVTESIEAETRQVLDNLGAVLAEAGLGFQDVVKCGVFMTDLGQFAAFDAVYAEYFGVEPPARATVEVRALPRGAHVEIDAIARTR